MKTSGRRTAGALVATAACMGTLAVATPAQAGLLSGLLGGTKAPTTTATTAPATTAKAADPLSPILGLLGGQNGLGGVVQGVLCPVTSVVDGLVKNPVTGGLSPITSGLTTLACNAGVLDYRFETKLRRADGTLVSRSQVAQLGVPTPLNVDDDLAPDLVGTITIVGRNAVGLKVERASGERSTLPVQVEAIVGDPKGTILGGRRIAIGYDARDDRAPGTFVVSTPADALLAPKPTVEATVTQTARGERVAVLAGVFSGTGAQRVDATQARLDYRQAPDVAAFTVGLGGSTAVRATTNRPGGLLTADLSTPDLDARAELRTLPATLDLALDGDGSRVAYDGNGTSIGRLIADVRSKKPLLGDADRLRADLDGMPVKGAIALRAPETTQGAFGLSSEGEIDRIEVQAANGAGELPTVPGAATDAGALVDTTDGRFRLAARVFRLRSVSVAPSPAAVDLRTGVAQTFRIDARTPGARAGSDPLHLTALVRDLPTALKIGLQDGDTPRLTYAADAPVSELSVEAEGLGLVEGADRLRLALRDLDGDGALAFRAPEGVDDRIGLTTDGLTIGRLDVAATGGGLDYPSVPGGDDAAGAFVDTTGGAFRLAARILRPESVTLGTSPVSLALKTGVAQPFRVDATVPGSGDGAAPVHLQADILDLPERLTLGLEDGADGTRLRYAADAPVETIDVTGTGIPLVDGADKLHVRLSGVEGDGAIGVRSGDDGRIGLTADGVAVKTVEVEAADAGSPFPSVPGPADGAGAFLDTTGGAFRLAARVFELRSITVDPDPITLEATTGVAKPFRVDATLAAAADAPAGTAPTHVEALVEDLPTTFKLGLADADDGGSKLAYQASERVSRLEVEATGVPILEGTDRIAAAVRDVPKAFDLTLPSQEGDVARPLATLGIGDGEAAIGELRLAAGATDLPATGLQADGTNDPAVADRFEYRSADPAAIGVGVRLTGVKGLNLGLDPIAIRLDQDETRTKPVDLVATLPGEAGAPAATINGRFSKTSASTSIAAVLQDGQPTRLTFGNARNLDRLTLNATNLGSIPKLDLALDNLPRTLNVCVDSAGGCRRANPNALSGGTAAGLNRPYAAQTSIDLDDAGTQLAGQRTTLNASLPVDGNVVNVENLRFRNLGLDLGQSGTFKYAGQDIPRIYLFADSRGQPFTINRIQYPGTIESFKIGTDASPATATNRIVWLRGTKGFLGAQFDNLQAGTLNCGGQRELSVKVLGLNINILNIFGQQVLPVCS
ncbi:hypothetical protein [Patulibacter sp.]|uniref:hypothetical protein n=1 Tax=Patulibacter sp. TaxID=1912859 RepID=UPI0027245830|nr:hypothetical protein [Patulibacter sp.]MDO9409279.1 hypothetical protein [Patulibacter sp.]